MDLAICCELRASSTTRLILDIHLEEHPVGVNEVNEDFACTDDICVQMAVQRSGSIINVSVSFI